MIYTGSFRTYTGPGRISTARYSPRGTPGGFKVYKKLAPGPWFNSCPTPGDYISRYWREILRPLDPHQVVDELHALAQQCTPVGDPVILCWEAAPLPNIGEKGWCHRQLVAGWISDALGVEVHEKTDRGAPTLCCDSQPARWREIKNKFAMSL